MPTKYFADIRTKWARKARKLDHSKKSVSELYNDTEKQYVKMFRDSITIRLVYEISSRLNILCTNSVKLYYSSHHSLFTCHGLLPVLACTGVH